MFFNPVISVRQFSIPRHTFGVQVTENPSNLRNTKRCFVFRFFGSVLAMTQVISAPRNLSGFSLFSLQAPLALKSFQSPGTPGTQVGSVPSAFQTQNHFSPQVYPWNLQWSFQSSGALLICPQAPYLGTGSSTGVGGSWSPEDW